MSNRKRKLEKEDDLLPFSLKQKKLKGKQTVNTTVQNENSIANLPHEILLLIFKKLSINNVCKVAQVCKSFRRAAYDNFLWYHIDLTGLVLNLKRLWKFFRHKCFSEAKSIRLSGNLHLNINEYQRTKQVCTKALMQKLTSCCKELKILEIRYCDLIDVDSEDLCENLEEINLIKCEIPLKWFTRNKFKNLTSLNLTGSSRICSTHIQDLVDSTVVSKLKILILKKCYRINDKSIEIIINFTQLEHLDLSETDIGQYGLQLLSSRLKNKLNYLNLVNCENVNQNEIKLCKESFVESSNFILDF